MRFGFIAKHRGVWPVSWLCEALGVSRSGFHAWLVRPPSLRARQDEAIVVAARSSFLASGRTYGARRVWRDVLADGHGYGLHRVERLMRREGLRARPRRRGLPADGGLRKAEAIACNVLDRQFSADAPNRKWVADFTYLWTAGGGIRRSDTSAPWSMKCRRHKLRMVSTKPEAGQGFDSLHPLQNFLDKNQLIKSKSQNVVASNPAMHTPIVSELVRKPGHLWRRADKVTP